MSNVEKFIEDCTKDCSNYTGLINKKTCEGYYVPWLTPDQARKAVEIAKEEIYEWLNKKLSAYIDYRCRGVGESVEEFVKDLKQAMKNE